MWCGVLCHLTQQVDAPSRLFSPLHLASPHCPLWCRQPDPSWVLSMEFADEGSARRPDLRASCLVAYAPTPPLLHHEDATGAATGLQRLSPSADTIDKTERGTDRLSMPFTLSPRSQIAALRNRAKNI